jgi:hypothetical protein
MTAVKSIYTGGRMLASAARNAYPQAAIKAIDETEGVNLASPATLISDRELYLPVAASTTYLFCCYLDYEGNNSGGHGGVEYLWAVPSGATLRYVTIGSAFGGGTQLHSTQVAGTRYQLDTPTGSLMAAVMLGTLITSTLAGTVQLTWSTYQDVANHSTIHAQSFLALWQASP